MFRYLWVIVWRCYVTSMYLVLSIALCLYNVYLIYMYMYICIYTDIFLGKSVYRLVAVSGTAMRGI
jgi:hypothetical protein